MKIIDCNNYIVMKYDGNMIYKQEMFPISLLNEKITRFYSRAFP